jgi:hypothetical protein
MTTTPRLAVPTLTPRLTRPVVVSARDVATLLPPVHRFGPARQPTDAQQRERAEKVRRAELYAAWVADLAS